MLCSKNAEEQEESFIKFPCLWPNCFSLNHDTAEFEEKSKHEEDQNIEMKVITSEEDIARQSHARLTPSNSNR
jgi:hypothetical protein